MTIPALLEGNPHLGIGIGITFFRTHTLDLAARPSIALTDLRLVIQCRTVLSRNRWPPCTFAPFHLVCIARCGTACFFAWDILYW
jgi:hypothetical protein